MVCTFRNDQPLKNEMQRKIIDPGISEQNYQTKRARGLFGEKTFLEGHNLDAVKILSAKCLR